MTLDETQLDQRFLEWRDWLERGEIFSGVMDEIVIIRQVWNRYRQILDRAPDEARFHPTFHEWVGHNYGQTIGTAVRRQVEARESVISLGRLLDLLARFPRVVSRDRFVRLRPPFESDAETAERFDRFNGDLLPILDPTLPAMALEDLRLRTSTVRTWVNKSVAHWDPQRRTVFQGISFDEIHAAAEAVVDAFVLWRGFLCGSQIDTEIAMLPWERIFRVPWAPHLAHPFGRLGDESTPRSQDASPPG